MTETLEQVAIADVIVDLNVRTDARVDKSFVSSIRNHGIIQPPVGWRDGDGKVHITVGQRRTLAAMEIGHEEISVIIKPQEIAEAERIVTQLTENDQRQQLSDSERLFGYKELRLIGLSMEQIARKTNKPKAHVETALKVAESDVAADAVVGHQLSLDQAALLTEFEDNPADVEELVEVASQQPGRLEHAAQQIRDRRAFEITRAEILTEANAAGWETLEQAPSYSEEKSICQVEQLWRVDDPEHTRLTLETALEYSGRCVYVGSGWSGAFTRYYIRDYAQQGLTTYGVRAALSDDEKAERKAERETNKLLKSATAVRRAWLSTLLVDQDVWKLPIKEVVAVLARSILSTDYSASERQVQKTTVELLRLEPRESQGMWDNAAAEAIREYSKVADPLRIALAVALARSESVVGDPGWKAAREDSRTVEYLATLQGWGYTLSEVEEQILAPKKGRRK